MKNIFSGDRKSTLNELLNYEKGLTELQSSLSAFGWDSEDELVTLCLYHFKGVLKRYLEGELSEDDVNGWANLIEMREDVKLDSTHEDLLKELIFELANPEINGKLTEERALEIQALK